MFTLLGESTIRTGAAAHRKGERTIEVPAWKDELFAAVFSRTLVYTILFEDLERDLEFLALGPGDRVLTVAGAGCGVASLVAEGPARVDVVDFNAKHLAVTALKVNALRRLASYDELYALFARGRHPRPRAVVEQLADGLPAPLQRFWKSGWRMFQDDFYAHGFSTKNLSWMRRFWPITPELLKALNRKPRGERGPIVFDMLKTSLKKPILAGLIRSPLGLIAAGINYTQRQRNLRALGATDEVDGVIEYACRLVETDIEANWIAWHMVTGQFNWEHPDCLPLYLRRPAHERARDVATEVAYRHDNLLRVLEAAPASSWTHFCLSDVVDWLGDEARRSLLRAVHRSATPGARVICRTVEDDDIVSQLGLGEHFRVVEPMSTLASRSERSCLYRRVNCYEVLK